MATTQQRFRDDPEEDTLDEAIREEKRTQESQIQGNRIEELSSSSSSSDSDSDDAYEDIPTGPPFPGNHKPKNLPPWLLSTNDEYNLFHLDADETPTTQKQRETTTDCLSYLLGDKLPLPGITQNSHNIPHLNREAHIKFLKGNLARLPAPYVAMDASRPWVFYWILGGMSFMGRDVSRYKQRLMETVQPLQNPTGGFGGGHGQLSHCAATYATLLALTAVGGLECVDRKAMWQWLGQVKQADGGFRMAENAEEDIRGAYCAMTALCLLNLPLDLPPEAPARSAGLTKFTDGLGEWVGRCQTYEGGIAGAPTNEAHGAYAFCALACLSILDAPHISIPKYLDVDSLLHWLTSTQTTPEGGFAGRANKLPDACYSHWIGGCWALIQAALGTKQDLWSREGLIRYLLCCGQQPGKRGGMRDKPSARADAYHTCYSLAGLSAAMNHYSYDVKGETQEGRLLAPFNWTAETASESERQAWTFDKEDAVLPVHPVFVLPMDVVERAEMQFKDATF